MCKALQGGQVRFRAAQGKGSQVLISSRGGRAVTNCMKLVGVSPHLSPVLLLHLLTLLSLLLLLLLLFLLILLLLLTLLALLFLQFFSLSFSPDALEKKTSNQLQLLASKRSRCCQCNGLYIYISRISPPPNPSLPSPPPTIQLDDKALRSLDETDKQN